MGKVDLFEGQIIKANGVPEREKENWGKAIFKDIMAKN